MTLNNIKEARKGDVVKAQGIHAEIEKIYYQDYDRHENMWDIEFLDTTGHHRHWKQCFDGGELVQYKTAEEARENGDSRTNQTIKGRFIEQNVYSRVGTMVEYILQKSYEDSDAPFSWDDITNYYPDHSDRIEEIEEELEALEEQKEELEDKQGDTQEEIEEAEEAGDTDTVNACESLFAVYSQRIEEVEDKITALEDEQEELENDTAPAEIFEWWRVSSFLADKLNEYGYCILDGDIWGRTTTGQAILLDYVITLICSDMEILAGQRYAWEDDDEQ